MASKEPSNARTMPRWTVPFVWAVGLLILYGIGPWALSLVGPRHGWAAGSPGPWNMLGLGLITAGFSVLLWCISLHFKHYSTRVPMDSRPRFSPPPRPLQDLTKPPVHFRRHHLARLGPVLWKPYSLPGRPRPRRLPGICAGSLRGTPALGPVWQRLPSVQELGPPLGRQTTLVNPWFGTADSLQSGRPGDSVIAILALAGRAA